MLDAFVAAGTGSVGGHITSYELYIFAIELMKNMMV